MKLARTRTLPVPRERVWAVVGDPWHEPRWWPRVTRVEDVRRGSWTSVLRSERRNNLVRVDWTVEVDRKPDQRRWAQEIVGTAFERIFDRNAVEVRLEATPGGTRVTLEIEQEVRGSGRFVPVVFRRGLRRQIETALDGLEAAL